MKIDIKWAAAAVVMVILAAAAYTIGREQGRKAETPEQEKSFARTAKVHPSPMGEPGKTSPAQAHPPIPGREAVSPQRGVTPTRPGDEFTHFRVGNRNVKDIYADGPLVWVGFSGGVIRYDTRTGDYRLFDNRSGLLSNGVFHVSKLGDKIVVGTYGGGMSLYDKKADQWDNINIPDGLGDQFVYDVLKTSSGDVWIATWSGVNRVRGGQLRNRGAWDLFTVENTGGGLPNDWVYCLGEGANGEIWLGTEGGLARFKDGEWKNWQHSDGLGAPYEKVRDDIKFTSDPGSMSEHHRRQKEEQGLEGVDIAYNPNYIVSMTVDRRDGVVWAGTWGGGIGRFDGTSWKNYTVDEGLPGNHIFMLMQDAEGRIWAGTNNGLARMDDAGKFTVFTRKDGLFSDNVFSMAFAGDGSVWVGSFGGVARLAKGVLE